MKKKTFIDHSKKVKINPNVWGPISSLQHREHMIVLYMLIFLNPERDYRLKIHRTTYLEHGGGGWRLIHAENIHVVTNVFDDSYTLVSGKNLHRCTLYFPSLPHHVHEFSLIERCGGKGIFNKSDLFRPQNGMLWLQLDLDDSY